MKNSLAHTTLILAVTALAACNETRHHHPQDAPPNPAPQQLSQAEMPAYCRGEASAKFGQRPQAISTLPAERDHGMFTVYGQYPPEGSHATFFTCTFSSDGELVGVDKQ